MIINLTNFFQFLMDNKILHPYMKYLKINNEWRKYHSIIENESNFLKTYIAENYSREFIIKHAFPWDKTHEGFDFWESINIKWRTYMNTIKQITTNYYMFNNGEYVFDIEDGFPIRKQNEWEEI